MNKIQKIFIIIGLVFSLSIVLLTPIAIIIFEESHRQNYLYDIYIQRDSDFKNKYNFPGEGTLEDPYIIANLVISTNKINAIRIGDVTSCFIIRNCTLISTLSEKSYGQHVYLIYVNARQSPKVVITNNTISAPYYINYFTNYYTYSDFLEGICVENCNYVLIENNTMSNLDFSIMAHNLQSSMIVNNYCFNIYNIGLFVTGCTGILIENNTLFNLERGMMITVSSSLDIKNNNISFCEDIGLVIDSYSSIISNNILNNNTIGILIRNSRNATIISNWLEFNSEYGISIEDQYNENITLYHNYFLHNYFTNSSCSQVFDDSNSTWYNIDLLEGNYWSDYIWAPDTVYYIDGGENYDPYPMEIL